MCPAWLRERTEDGPGRVESHKRASFHPQTRVEEWDLVPDFYGDFFSTSPGNFFPVELFQTGLARQQASKPGREPASKRASKQASKHIESTNPKDRISCCDQTVVRTPPLQRMVIQLLERIGALCKACTLVNTQLYIHVYVYMHMHR